MPLTAQQSDFIEKFIGVSQGSADAANGDITLAEEPMKLWRVGKEATDKSLSALQSILKSKGMPDLDRIADFGLNGLSDRNQTQLMKALFEYSSADSSKRSDAASALMSEVAAYRKFIENDEVVRLCENNPFGVSVDIRGPIIDALDRIESAIV